MECNKEEALRAKEIAENKMQNKDFPGARKIALKAQKLYNDLENISQMLMVCDVHCAAEQRVFGNEMDWYSILQIEQTADEATIKKQYRKFALLLHPDKNNFPGAEAAFKLIGEAQRVLLDQSNRSQHDMKRRAFVSKPAAPYRPPQKASFYSNIGIQNNFRGNFTGLNPQHQQPPKPPQPGFSNGRPTFWTTCPFCSVRYQFYREIIHKSIRCQTCDKPFIAYESYGPDAPAATNLSQPAFPQQKNVPYQGAFKVELGSQGNFAAENSKTDFFPKTGCASDVGTEKVNGKRGRKQAAESSESCDTESSSDSEEDMVIDENGDIQAGQNIGCSGVRRSERRKQQVSYKENLSDDEDLVSHPKRAKGSGSSCASEAVNGDVLKEEACKINKQSGLAADVEEDEKLVKQKGSACFEESLPNVKEESEKVNQKDTTTEDDCKKRTQAHTGDRKENSEAPGDSLSDSSSKDPEIYSYPDPDFNDFDKDRKDECFEVGQTWAIYDILDAMPRFYARIRKVYSPGFKLRITWLEPDPDDENEIGWVDEGLPASCGKFKHGNSENTEDRLMFSHLICWEKGSRRDTYKIFPRKGETWALFKNWNIKWSADADTNRKYEYEFVEILSEYAEGVGICVAYLAKVKGFVSLFCRTVKEGNDTYQIPPAEILRFSHRVPSFKLTGEERDGVPKGSFELDPASLPTKLEEIDAPGYLKSEAGTQPNGSSSRSSDEVKPMMQSEGSASTQQAEVMEAHVNRQDYGSDCVIEDRSAPRASDPEAIEIPDPEFFNFDAEKSPEKFEIGQIWSLYSDEDGLPKYYGQIKKIESDPVFKLHLRWLAACPQQNNMIRWHDKDMPICCGRFKIKKAETQAYTSTDSFSHVLRAEPAGKKDEYAIFPQKGEVWALYRNWTAEIKYSDLEDCEYDIVEVLEETDMWIKVLVLERVVGFNSVFKTQLKGGIAVTMEIPQVELLRFSHHIPAFRLTEERGGSLRGFLELDPAALPVHYFLF